MSENRFAAIVGIGAILPDAPNVTTFWNNLKSGRYSIQDVPENRWNASFYYDPDPTVPDKTNSKIGGWVRDFKFDPIKLGIAIPPRVLAVMDETQQWSIAVCHQALTDFGYPNKPLEPNRTAVILGNSLAGEKHSWSNIRILLPEYLDILAALPDFRSLNASTREALINGMRKGIDSKIPPITEDTMPGELANIIAGRVANVFNFGGPNFTTDAACASSLAALQTSIDGLYADQYDAVLTGGIDRNMGPESFVKFSKIGALSPDGSRPYAEGANGFVMGEGAVVFLIKRLKDAEKNGDKIYAVIRGVGGSSDGKGKGITAPNPIGQQRAIVQAWKNAGLSPETASLIEGHGTSTKVGDVAEVNSLNNIFGNLGLPIGKIALGSVKSNIGHLKSAAGAAGLLKTILALHHNIIPSSANFKKPNPQLDFSRMPFTVNTESRPWHVETGEIRRAAVSSFGFGGTNFHTVLEEYIPERLTNEKRIFPGVDLNLPEKQITEKVMAMADSSIQSNKTNTPYQGLLFVTGETANEVKESLNHVLTSVTQGIAPVSECPEPKEVDKPERLAIDYLNLDELAKKGEKVLKALENDTAVSWQALSAQGVFHGTGKPGKVAFLFPGQGSQYINMLRELRDKESIVMDVFQEADRIMTPILGKPLTSYIFVDGDEAALAQAEKSLRDTTITQPAMLTANVAIMRLLNQFGFQPDYVIGHSLGEYAALVAAGVFTFAEALEIVSARGREMAKVSMEDNGTMAAVSAPLTEVEKVLKTINGYVVIANINSPVQCVIGGETKAVEDAIAAFQSSGFQAVKIPVSHAFHTRIVAPASEPLKKVIARMNIQMPRLPVIANVTGTLYPANREEIINLLGQQVASPVQFVKSMQTLYAEGVRIFVETGPKRVLSALAVDNLKDHTDVTVLGTNHPRKGALASINEALCGLYAAGVKYSHPNGSKNYHPGIIKTLVSDQNPEVVKAVTTQPKGSGRQPLTGSVVISGAGLGLPGKNGHVFDDRNINFLLEGKQFIESLDVETREAMLEKRVVRLVKSEAGAVMQTIDELGQTLKLAGQPGSFDPVEEFGLSPELVESLDISTKLAIAAGIDALRDAGIPLVMAYRRTSKGTFLPDRWRLPEALADETGVIFGSAFPGLDRMADEAGRFYQHKNLLQQIKELNHLQQTIPATQKSAREIIARRLVELENQLNEQDYHFDRRFIFRVLSMGHSQFGEYIGARGPNTHVNAACATTTHAISVAEDWIRAGRCRRVVVIAGDDIAGSSLTPWVGTGLMASGAATTEGDPRLAILPFDRRRNGMIMGMGAAALVIESEDAVRERGMRAICEILSAQIANSAFHGTRLDVQHVSEMMDRVITQAESRFGINRREIAPETVFVSHETYTPARGGSASAEIRALRQTFGSQANQIVIANTKGYTGHTMGVGIEDVLAVKSLETGIVPPIANINVGFEPDPELGDLNLSKGGQYPVQYALRLGAGFGSQLAMTLLRKIPGIGERTNQKIYDQWLSDIAGYTRADTEVTKHTLRICHAGPPTRTPARSKWEYGDGPTAWAAKRQEETVQTDALPTKLENIETKSGDNLPEPLMETGRKAAPALTEITRHIISLVSEKTGYPIEMLDPELDLEADLGVDTVKQAELFATIRQHYGIPRKEDLRLVDYNTLAKVVQFVVDNAPTQEPAPMVAMVDAQPKTEIQPDRQTAPADANEIKSTLLLMVSNKTGYPVEMLDLELDLEADLGIDTVKQAELFASLRNHYGIPRKEDLRLSDYNTLAKVIGFIQGSLEAQVSQPETGEAKVPHMASPVQAEKSEIKSASITGNSLIEEEEIKTLVLSKVSEKTGYPVEMLDIDLDLEADLGIDTVKQAELFATIRTHYGIPRREDLRLSEYNTLAKVIGFIQDSLKSLSAVQSEKTEPVLNRDLVVEASPTGMDKKDVSVNTLPVDPPIDSIEKEVLQEYLCQVNRYVPLPVLRPKMELCTPTGLKLDDNCRVLVISDHGQVGNNLSRQLRSRKVQVINWKSSRIKTETISKDLEIALAEGPINGVFFLPALDPEPLLAEMTLETWQGCLDQRITTLYTLFHSLPDQPFLICGTRMGGLHGYTSQGATAPMGGSVSGFAKALAQERPDSFVKIVDFSNEDKPASVATRLIDEALSDPGVIEVGGENNLRYSIGLVEKPCMPDSDKLTDAGAVFLVSGGSGGILGPVLIDLARSNLGTYYLLGRSPLPDSSDPDLDRVMTDRIALKNDLMKRMAQDKKKVTPVEVEQKLTSLERAASTLATMKRITDAGGKAHYLKCDVTDPTAVKEVVHSILTTEGQVDTLIHAAGLEHSRKLESKPFAEFHSVFSVKADGFFNLFKALEDNKRLPKNVILFSSVAGRFGNSGQTDYSAANDLLSKIASSFHNQYPDIRCITLDWGAWAEVGMASRGNIPSLMKIAGIGMLQPSEAAPLVRTELVSNPGDCEVVLAGSLGLLKAPRRPDGGLNLELTNKALREGKPLHTMFSRVTGLDLYDGVILEAELDPKKQPFLKDHQMDGTPVLPGVMGIEGFSVASKHIASVLASNNSGFDVSELENIQFMVPIKFYRNQPRWITWKANVVREERGLVAHVTLESTLQRANKTEHSLHFSGRVHLVPAKSRKTEKLAIPPEWNSGLTIKSEDIYKLYFHGPTFQVIDEAQRSNNLILGRLQTNLPPLTIENQPVLSTPLLVELCFQTAGLWEAEATGYMGLPRSIQRLTLYKQHLNGAAIYAEVKPVIEQSGMMHFDARVVDAEGRLYLEMKNYRTIPLPYTVDKKLTAPLKVLVSEK